MALLLLIGQLLWLTRSQAWMIDVWLSQIEHSLLLWRIALFILLLAVWPWWIDRLAVRYQWSDEKRVYVSGLRWRLAIWFVVIELLLVQGIAIRFVQELSR